MKWKKYRPIIFFLKAQINPHFLHNTLNFLYAKSLPYSSELSEGILTLSEIMRYSLEKEEDRGGKVLLTKEIEHVNNVIKIQQLRFDHSAANFIRDKRGSGGIAYRAVCFDYDCGKCVQTRGVEKPGLSYQH